MSDFWKAYRLPLRYGSEFRWHAHSDTPDRGCREWSGFDMTTIFALSYKLLYFDEMVFHERVTWLTKVSHTNVSHTLPSCDMVDSKGSKYAGKRTKAQNRSCLKVLQSYISDHSIINTWRTICKHLLHKSSLSVQDCKFVGSFSHWPMNACDLKHRAPNLCGSVVADDPATTHVELIPERHYDRVTVLFLFLCWEGPITQAGFRQWGFFNYYLY